MEPKRKTPPETLSKLLRIILYAEGLTKTRKRIRYSKFYQRFVSEQDEKTNTSHITLTLNSKYGGVHKIDYDFTSSPIPSKSDGIYNLDYEIVACEFPWLA
jgi:hypothetical protein